MVPWAGGRPAEGCAGAGSTVRAGRPQRELGPAAGETATAGPGLTRSMGLEVVGEGGR